MFQTRVPKKIKNILCSIHFPLSHMVFGITEQIGHHVYIPECLYSTTVVSQPHPKLVLSMFLDYSCIFLLSLERITRRILYI
jgi:hypothetical protein